MRANRVTSIMCLFLAVVFGVATVTLQDISAGISSVISNVFTGFFVSSVLALIGYFYEKEKILNKTESNLLGLYINMIVTKEVTGNKLGQFSNVLKLSDLRFGDITSSARLNVTFMEDMELESYSGFISCSRTTNIYDNLRGYKSRIYNLKNIASGIEIASIKYDLMISSAENLNIKGISLSSKDMIDIHTTRDSIVIKVAKLHEYEDCLLMELDELAEGFFALKNRDYWQETKRSLLQQANDIVPK
ncbi:MAG: hypothetical protein KBF14_05210 [Synergistaceae bacterium]|nr:hypothetical protein [Synergistaceae bacterium]